LHDIGSNFSDENYSPLQLNTDPHSNDTEDAFEQGFSGDLDHSKTSIIFALCNGGKVLKKPRFRSTGDAQLFDE
jgi:hypothetical protein